MIGVFKERGWKPLAFPALMGCHVLAHGPENTESIFLSPEHDSGGSPHTVGAKHLRGVANAIAAALYEAGRG